MPPLWRSQFKYDDGTTSNSRSVVGGLKRKARDSGKIIIDTDSCAVGIPVNKGASIDLDVSIEPQLHVKVTVSDPLNVYYILSEKRIIKAADPNNTSYSIETSQ